MMTIEQIRSEIKKCEGYVENYEVMIKEDIEHIHKCGSLDAIAYYVDDAKRSQSKIVEYRNRKDLLLAVIGE